MIRFFVKRSCLLCLVLYVVGTVNSAEVNTPSLAATGDAVAALPPKEDLLLPGETFHVANHAAFVMLPEGVKSSRPQPWIWYCITRFTGPNYPDHHEKWMHEQFVAAGIAVAGVDVGESFGSPRGRKVFDAFYEEMTVNRGFASKPCMFGRSRGGLQASSWAIENAEKVAGIGGFYPVFDLRGYPGLQQAAPAYEMTVQELEAALPRLNPVARLHVLAKARVPAFFIHGDVDQVVTLEENTVAFMAAYEANGAKDIVGLIVAKGQGHNYWPGFFRCRELIDFVISRAGEGAVNSK